MKCENCKYWDRVDIKLGMCRRYAPHFVLGQIDFYKNNSDMVDDAFWPWTDNNDWCGEHKLKEINNGLLTEWPENEKIRENEAIPVNE